MYRTPKAINFLEITNIYGIDRLIERFGCVKLTIITLIAIIAIIIKRPTYSFQMIRNGLFVFFGQCIHTYIHMYSRAFRIFHSPGEPNAPRLSTVDIIDRKTETESTRAILIVRNNALGTRNLTETMTGTSAGTCRKRTNTSRDR